MFNMFQSLKVYSLQFFNCLINALYTYVYSTMYDKFGYVGLALLTYIILEYVSILLLQITIITNNIIFIKKMSVCKLINIIIGLYISHKYTGTCADVSEEKYLCVVLNFISFKTIILISLICLYYLYDRYNNRRIINYIETHHNRNNNFGNYEIANDIHIVITPYINQNDLPIAITINEPKDIICSICLEQQIETEEWCKLNCNHEYHKDCIYKWLRTTDSCPDCRKPIKN